MITKPLLLSINDQYFYKLLDWRNISFERVGKLLKVDGFCKYNYLIEINKIFSTCPMGDPVDRTESIVGPFNFRVLRPWKLARLKQNINEVFKSRVDYYVNQHRYLDLFWSGGADSTAMVTAFLTHFPNLDQIRLVYSPHSLYENRDFFEFVTKKFPKLDTLDISGDVYIKNNFDRIIITGHGGDEFTASLDESFFNSVGGSGLEKPWKDLFWSKTQDSEFIDFCEEYFAKSGRPINTVLEARWWFYAATKSQVFGPKDISFLFNQPLESIDCFSSFYDCQEFEDYMWNNVEQIINRGGEYRTYKKFLRQYINDFYSNLDYLNNASKMNSIQLQIYRRKKIELLDTRWICLLEDAAVIRTKNLPLLSQKEFVDTYGNSLDYLFNQPN
jgi:hypothetical protein